MITGTKDIHKAVAVEENLPLEMVDSIGAIICQHLRASLNDPRELSYELPEVGTFTIRFKRFENYFSYLQKGILADDPEVLKHIEDDPENYERAKMMIDKMQIFRNDKKEKRNQRDEQNQTNESCEDQSS